MGLKTADELEKRIGFAALWAGKDVVAAFVQYGMVNMHGAAGFAFDWFSHEGCKAIVFQRGLAQQSFEEKHLIGKFHGITMIEVDFKLTRAAFLGDAVDLKTLDFGIFIDVINDGAVIIHGGHGIGLSCGGRAARAPDHWFDRFGWVGIGRDEEKFHLGGDDRGPAFFFVEIDHAF